MIRCRVTKNDLKLLNSNDMTLEARHFNDIRMITCLHHTLR